MAKSLDRETLARVAPKLAELSIDTLFNDIWKRETLSPRERSLITLGALTAQGRVQQLPWHINFAQQNGLTREEIVEVFTHLAFYAGWPAAVSALGCLEDCGNGQMLSEERL
ncbi:carboxymuconolactone decarboxylase family protein [Pectobacterium colocasium]|uniref:carboxymuconolactone decarboxylase family protein n=1 Tax=Pectobacterium TaxID=122277 RepID=UPI0027A0F9B9|nr:carboxymuconolactone decarboxylase family protein [Pectobacterium sp. PL152]WED67985.1 carboxymuconolactone decarboxylase family protein [Pectobacterium colocasium]